jgi:hypothetical protein
MFSRDFLVAIQHNFYLTFVSKCQPKPYSTPQEKSERLLFLQHYKTICRAVKNKIDSKIDLYQAVMFFEKFGVIKSSVLTRNVFKPKSVRVYANYAASDVDPNEYIKREERNEDIDDVATLFETLSVNVDISKQVQDLYPNLDVYIKQEGKEDLYQDENQDLNREHINNPEPEKETNTLSRIKTQLWNTVTSISDSLSKLRPRYYTRFQARLSTLEPHRHKYNTRLQSRLLINV